MRARAGIGWAALCVVAGLVVGGCGSGGDDASGAVPTSTATPDGLALEAPTSYDPCVGVSKDILDQLELHAATRPNTVVNVGPGGTKWRGCDWVRSKGYAAAVQTTNVTLAYVKKSWSIDFQEFTVGGRKATSVRKSEDHPDEVCSLNVEMQGGSLEIHIVNPPSRDETGHMDACDIARQVAELVVPTLPPGA